MFQTDQATAAASLPTPAAAGTQGYFTNGNPSTGVAATILDADFMNMLMLELANIVTAAGITLSKTTYNQVLSAIKRIGQNTVVLADTGVANAYTAVNSTPLVAGTWVDGVVQAVKIAHANTGASTYAPDGLPAIPIYGLGLQPLQGSELPLNGTAILMRTTIASVNSGNPICVLMECFGGAQQVPAATQSQHAVQLQQLGNMQGVVTVNANTTLTSTQTGSYVQISSGSGLTLTLPAVKAGAAFPIYNNTNATHTLKGAGTNVINNGSGNANTYTIQPWGAIWVVSDGASWSIVAGVGDVSLLANGWKRTPDGLIEVWGAGVTNSSGQATITLPLSFPNTQLAGVVSGQNGSAIAACVTIQSLTTTTIVINAVNGSAAAINGLTVNFRAWGK